MIGDPAGTLAASRRLVVTNLAAGLLVGSLVAWIDWGGVGQSFFDRLMPACFASQGAMSLATGLQFRSYRYHPSWMAAEMCGAMFGACMTVAMLSSGITAGVFGIAAITAITAQFRNLRAWKRAITERLVFPSAPRAPAAAIR